jgi:phospholipid transport system transporter-binding protein
MPFALPATVVMPNAASTAAALLAAVRGGERTVDAGAVTHSDSSLIALLLHARRAAQDLQVINVPAKVTQLAALYGVGEFLMPRAAAVQTAAHHT